MTLKKMLNQRKMSTYRLSQMSQIPYSTVSDLVSEKTRLSKSSVDVAVKIAKALTISMDELVGSVINEERVKRVPFELFKSSLRHQLHDLGDKAFMTRILEMDLVEVYVSRQWYPEALYTLAMLDVLCRVHQLPLATKYDHYRTLRLDQILYPADVLILSLAQNNDQIKQETYDNSLLEFKRFNIVEGDIRNVI